MFKVHVISDLEYGFHEETIIEDTVIPDVDLVILNGNIGTLKRSVLYAHEIANKYPNIPFVLNLGELERYWCRIPKFEFECEDSISIRVKNNKSWPKNLYWKDPRNDDPLLITLPNGQVVSVFPIYGFPKINSYEGSWQDSYWYRYYCVETAIKNNEDWLEKPKDSSFVPHGPVPTWASQEWVNNKFEEMQTKIRKWELNLKHFGILVTHLNPYNDPRFENCSVSPFLIHLNKGLWVTAKTKVNNINYLGAKLYSNPGRGESARSQVIEVDTGDNL